MIAPDDVAQRGLELTAARLPGADVAVHVESHEMALTRFAESVIHQNVAEDLNTVRVVVHHEGRTASSSATVSSPGDLGLLVDRLAATVAIAPLDRTWPGLAPVAPVVPTGGPDPATAGASPADRAEVVRGFVEGAGGLETAGYCRTTHRRSAFTSTTGQSVSDDAAECSLAGIARTPSAHGMSDGVARVMPLRFTDLDGHALGARAAAKARSWVGGQGPVDLPPGRYQVVLEPDAVADVLNNLAAWGYAGRAVTERRSFVTLGEQQLDPALTLHDDPLSVGIAFDGEGTPTSRLGLADAGRSVAVAHDRRTAAEAGTRSTGHSVVGAMGSGAARHLGLEPSAVDVSAQEVAGPVCDSSAAALVAGVDRGILVSDLWYTRVLDSRQLVLTGLTRNGVWLVEDGEVTRPVSNLRFTQSYSEALAPGQVLGVGASATPIPGDTYTATSPRFGCPALRLASWNFTGGASG